MSALLQSLRDYYLAEQSKWQQAIEPLVRCDLMTAKAQLVSDHLCFYMVDQDVALMLSSYDEYGMEFKENMDGLHPVMALGGMHWKRSSEIPIQPGIEGAVSSLINLVSINRRNAGPTTTTKITLFVERIKIEQSPPELAKVFKEELNKKTPVKSIFANNENLERGLIQATKKIGMRTTNRLYYRGHFYYKTSCFFMRFEVSLNKSYKVNYPDLLNPSQVWSMEQ